jgi:hypothetical protein
MQNADLTWEQDLGAVTELLSGEFFRWFGRSTSHQLWSSAMVVTPAVRGMFGLEWNAQNQTLTVTPRLPAQWNEARISEVPLGNSKIGVELQRNHTTLLVRLTGAEAKSVKLASHAQGAKIKGAELRIPLPAVEIGIDHGLPEAGSTTSQLKVLDQWESVHSVSLQLAAPADSVQTLFLRVNDPKIHPRTDEGQISADFSSLRVRFPSGTGYVKRGINLSW